MKKIVVILLNIFCFLILFTNLVFACTCIPPDTPRRELDKSSAVFSGKVIEIKEYQNEYGYYDFLVKFKVQEIWKGVDDEVVTVSTATQTSACGYPFKIGERYLVYTHGEKDALSTSICSRTNNLADAEEDLRELGEGEKAKPKAELLGNHPNPSNLTTTIGYLLHRPGFVQLKVYNISGQLVQILVYEEQPVGEYNINWDGKNNKGKLVSSGIYIYSLKVEKSHLMTRRMVIIR